MRIISRRALREFWKMRGNAEAEQPLRAWYHEVTKARWKTPAELKADFRNASILKGSRAVFNVPGNKFQVIVKVNYAYGIAYVRFVGTHEAYDQIDATEI